MTNFGRQTSLKLRSFSQLLILSLTLGTLQPASARSAPSGNSGQTYEYHYVQAPAMSSHQSFTYQTVITPGQIPDGQLDQVGHLWPRSISYSMQTNSVEAYLQSDLKIGMQYNYSFNFDLNARTAQGRGMGVPEGWYQLQIAVIKTAGSGKSRKQNQLERYVTSTSMFLKVSNASFGKKISLRFNDIEATSVKNHLFVEFIPLKEDGCVHNGRPVRCINLDQRGEPDSQNSILEPRPGYKTYLVEMPFLPYQPSGGKSGDADDLSDEEQAFLGGSLAKYIAKAQLLKNRQALQPRVINTPEMHAQKNRLTSFQIDDPEVTALVPFIRKTLESRELGMIHFEDGQRNVLKSLCTQLSAYQSSFQRPNYIRWCMFNPEKYMRLSRVVHVGQAITGKVERIAQKPLAYTLMSNFMANRSVSRDTFSSVNIKPPDFVSKVLDLVGIAFSHSISVGNSRSRSETGVASMADSLDFNYVIFKIPTTGSQQCLEVRALDDEPSFLSDTPKDGNKGFYVCDRKDNGIIEIPEIYAHVFERCKDTTMMECDGLTQSLNKVMRGEGEVSALFYGIRKGIRAEHNNRVMPFGDYKNADSYFNGLPMTGNMELITPVEFPRESVPSFIELATGQRRIVMD